MAPIFARRICIVVLLSCCGCTHIQLRNNSFQQAKSAHDLQQQQVLDNLAMFVVDPNAVPFFTVVGSGSSSVTDSGSASTSLSWLRSGFQSVGLMLGGSRVMQENFTLGPITDPDKLARMRCAYQAAVGYHDSNCIDCCGLQKEWGDRRWDGKPPSVSCIDDCSMDTGWFCTGRKCDVPKNGCYVGNYCGKYVWVPPCHSDKLAILTFTILDYATAVPPPPPTKTVKKIRKQTCDGIDETIEESLVVPVDQEQTLCESGRQGRPSAAAQEMNLPAPSPPSTGPRRQDYYQTPQQPPSIVIPVNPF